MWIYKNSHQIIWKLLQFSKQVLISSSSFLSYLKSFAIFPLSCELKIHSRRKLFHIFFWWWLGFKFIHNFSLLFVIVFISYSSSTKNCSNWKWKWKIFFISTSIFSHSQLPPPAAPKNAFQSLWENWQSHCRRRRKRERLRVSFIKHVRTIGSVVTKQSVQCAKSCGVLHIPRLLLFSQLTVREQVVQMQEKKLLKESTRPKTNAKMLFICFRCVSRASPTRLCEWTHFFICKILIFSCVYFRCCAVVDWRQPEDGMRGEEFLLSLVSISLFFGV